MIRDIFDLLYRFFGVFKIWFIVSPFEQALRVRLGKHVKLLGPGVHIKLPLIDALYVQNVRLRLSALGRQTITTRDGKTITFSASIGYSIQDVKQLYMTLHHAEETIASSAEATIADYISCHELKDCQPDTIQNEVSKKLNLSQYGLSDASIYLTEYTIVRTYRIIGDRDTFHSGSSLQTERPSYNDSVPSGY